MVHFALVKPVGRIIVYWSFPVLTLIDHEGGRTATKNKKVGTAFDPEMAPQKRGQSFVG